MFGRCGVNHPSPTDASSAIGQPAFSEQGTPPRESNTAAHSNGVTVTGNKVTYPVYMSAKLRKIYVTFGLTSVWTHEEYLAGDVKLT